MCRLSFHYPKKTKKNVNVCFLIILVKVCLLWWMFSAWVMDSDLHHASMSGTWSRSETVNLVTMFTIRSSSVQQVPTETVSVSLHPKNGKKKIKICDRRAFEWALSFSTPPISFLACPMVFDQLSAFTNTHRTSTIRVCLKCIYYDINTEANAFHKLIGTEDAIYKNSCFVGLCIKSCIQQIEKRIKINKRKKKGNDERIITIEKLCELCTINSEMRTWVYNLQIGECFFR